MAPKKPKNAGAKPSRSGVKPSTAEPVRVAAVTSKKAVALSLDIEAQVKGLLQELSAHDTAPATHSAATAIASSGGRAAAVARYSSVFDGLIGLGFTEEQVQGVLRELPLGTATLDGALDWLCIHTPTNLLPRSFVGSALGGRAGGSNGSAVRVMSRADPNSRPAGSRSGARRSGADGGSSDSGDEGQQLRPMQQARDEEIGMPSQAHGSGGGSGGSSGGGGGGAASSKAWILQYMAGQEADGSSSEDEAVRSKSPSSSDSEIEDWEIWGEPKEAANNAAWVRRRADRDRARLPLEVRRPQLAQEWAQAKAFAAAAKAAGDKVRQKTAGNLIRDLKQEMTRLGINEAEFAVTLAPPQAPTAASQPSTPAHVGAQPGATHPRTPAASTAPQQARIVDPGMWTGSDPALAGSNAAGSLGANKAAGPSIVRGVVRNEAAAEEGGGGEGEEDEDEWARGFLDLADLAAAATAAAAAPAPAAIAAAAAAAAAAASAPAVQAAAFDEPPISLSSVPSSGQEVTAGDESSPDVVASQSAPDSNAEDVSMTVPTDPSPQSQLRPSPYTRFDSNNTATNPDAASGISGTTLDPGSTADVPSTTSAASDDEPPAWDLFDSTAAEPPLPPGAAPATAAAAAAAASRNASALRRLLKVAASKGGRAASATIGAAEGAEDLPLSALSEGQLAAAEV
ncbi:MAG: hypothetical protein WDW36_006443 [Sanguina aurantia]